MTPKQIEAMKLALEALEYALNKPMWNRPKMTVAITALEEALAEHAMRETQRLGQEIEQNSMSDEMLQAITDPENQPSQYGTVTLDYHFEKIKKWEDLFERMSNKVLQQLEQEPVTIKRMKEWIEYLKRKSDFGQHMKIPSEMSAGTCWELAIELEQFINTTPPQQEPVIDKSAAIRIATSLGWTPQRKPLTDEEIMDACDSTGWIAPQGVAIDLARAIEAAHGIKESK